MKHLFLLMTLFLLMISTVSGQTVTGDNIFFDLPIIPVYCSQAIDFETSDTVRVIDFRAKTFTVYKNQSLVDDLLGFSGIGSYRSNGEFFLINTSEKDMFFPTQTEKRLGIWMTDIEGNASYYIVIYIQTLSDNSVQYYARIYHRLKDILKRTPSCDDWQIRTMGDSLKSLLEG